MQARASFVTLFDERQVRPGLNQTGEQPASLELDDARRNRGFRTAHEVIREPHEGDMNRPGWTIIRADVPRIGSDFETRAPFEVADDWSKLMIATRRADQPDAGTVCQRPTVRERIAPRRP